MNDLLDIASVIVGAPTLGYHLIDLDGNLLSVLTMEGARALLKDSPALRKRSFQVSFPREPRDEILEALLQSRFSPGEIGREFRDVCSDIDVTLAPSRESCPKCKEPLESSSGGKLFYHQFVHLLKSRALLNEEFWTAFSNARPRCLNDTEYPDGEVVLGILSVKKLFEDLL